MDVNNDPALINEVHPLHKRKFKQKILALLKKFKNDGSDFGSDEQYREALEREFMKAADGRGSKTIEELLEDDIEVGEETGSPATQNTGGRVGESATVDIAGGSTSTATDAGGGGGGGGGGSGSKSHNRTRLIGQHSIAGSILSTKNHHHPLHKRKFKQKILALLKKFKNDSGDFVSEEQYREALERELMKAADGRGSKTIEELLEEDIEAGEESGSDLDDWDNISDSSTPKPSLRPFFSSTTLDKI